jgi:hypothetical protein
MLSCILNGCIYRYLLGVFAAIRLSAKSDKTNMLLAFADFDYPPKDLLYFFHDFYIGHKENAAPRLIPE